MMKLLPADATITIHIHSDDLSAPTLEEVARVLVGVGQVIVGVWNVARRCKAALAEIGRVIKPPRVTFDTLDLALVSVGMMLVGTGMLLISVYL